MKRSFYCDNCGSEVDAKLEVCPFCSLDFKSTLCPKCSYSGKGSEFANGCPSCGYLSDQKKSNLNENYQTKKRRGWNPSSGTLWTLIILGVGVLGLFIYILISKL